MDSASMIANVMLRGAAMMLLALIGALLLRDHARILSARLGALFAFGAAAFVLNTLPAFAAHLAWWHAPVIALDSTNMFVFWLFTRALVDDDYRMRPWHLFVWCGFAALGIIECFGLNPLDSPLARPVGKILTSSTLVFALLAVIQSIATWREDLVEGRRRVRMFIVGATSLYGAVLAVSALTAAGGAAIVSGSPYNAFALVVVSLFAAWQFFSGRDNEMFKLSPAPRNSEGRQDDSADKGTLASGPVASPNPLLVSAIEKIMREDKIYREERVTLNVLAARLNLPEHRLRRVINQEMGYRNFNAFLNSYRVEEVRDALADPERSETAVLTLALDAGFQSVGPFNRAFKAVTGMTPTEFRRTNTTPDRGLSA